MASSRRSSDRSEREEKIAGARKAAEATAGKGSKAFKLPAGVSCEEATFVEPLACCVRAFRVARFVPGMSVVVLGSGISGALHILLAKALGAGKVLATDLHPWRIPKARELGADAACDARDDVRPGTAGPRTRSPQLLLPRRAGARQRRLTLADAPTLPHPLSIRARRRPEPLPKPAREVRHALESHAVGDLVHRDLGLPQPLGGLIQAELEDHLHRRLAQQRALVASAARSQCAAPVSGAGMPAPGCPRVSLPAAAQSDEGSDQGEQ